MKGGLARANVQRSNTGQDAIALICGGGGRGVWGSEQ